MKGAANEGELFHMRYIHQKKRIFHGPCLRRLFLTAACPYQAPAMVPIVPGNAITKYLENESFHYVFYLE